MKIKYGVNVLSHESFLVVWGYSGTFRGIPYFITINCM